MKTCKQSPLPILASVTSRTMDGAQPPLDDVEIIKSSSMLVNVQLNNPGTAGGPDPLSMTGAPSIRGSIQGIVRINYSGYVPVFESSAWTDPRESRRTLSVSEAVGHAPAAGPSRHDARHSGFLKRQGGSSETSMAVLIVLVGAGLHRSSRQRHERFFRVGS